MSSLQKVVNYLFARIKCRGIFYIISPLTVHCALIKNRYEVEGTGGISYYQSFDSQ